MFDADGSADYVTRTENAVLQMQFDHGIRQVRQTSFLHGVLFGIALMLYRRARRQERGR